MKATDLMRALGDVPEEYIARALEDAPTQKRTAFLVSKPFLAGVSTAACLLLIVGVGVGVWSRQQRIEPLPPQETQTTTVTQTETTASQTAPRPPETTVRSTTISSRVQPPVSEAALLTSVPVPESTVVTTAAKQTSAAEVTPGTPSDVTHTALPQTSVKPQTTAGTAVQHTPRVTETALPVTTKQGSDPTEPVLSSTKPSTESPETALPTEEQTDTMSTTQLPTEALTEKPTQKPTEKPTQAPTQSLTESSMPSTENPTQAPTQDLTESSVPSTESATQAPKPEENYDLLPGFRVEIKGEELTTIYSIDPVSPSPSEFYSYSLDSERFSIQSVQQDFSSRANYDIYDSDTRHHLTLRQNKRSVFMSSFRRKGTLESQSIGEYSGYWIFDNQGTRLVWDDGKYTFELFGANQYKELFLPVAEALQITDAVIP